MTLIVPRPTAPAPQPDGIYLGRVIAAERTQSRYGREQIALRLRLQNRAETRVWVNLSSKGLDMLIRAGAAEDTPEGVAVHDRDTLVGLIVQGGRGIIVPASKAVELSPSLRPLYEQARLVLRSR